MDQRDEIQGDKQGLFRTKRFKLRPFQDDFIFSQQPFPAMISGWGTGKTLCLILRALKYSQLIPNNLGFIIRREFEDLRDSTIRDFENYTGLRVNSKREVKFPNGSVICFRHFEELLKAGAKGHRNLQNVNLGWAAIEQGEELETDRAFWLIWGRLRRKLHPEPEFLELGLPPRSIWTIGNVAGDNWIKRLWKDVWQQRSQKGEKGNENKFRQDLFPLIEAQTWDNKENLERDFLDNLLILKEKKPEMYQRYVMNDWAAEVDAAVFRGVNEVAYGTFCGPDESGPDVEYVIGIDLAKTHDFNVVSVLNTRTKHFDYIARWNKTSWSITKERIRRIAKKFRDGFCFIDATGVGDPIVEDLQRVGVHIYCEKEKEHAGIKFNNTNKTQMVERYAVAIQEKMISWPNPEDLSGKEADLMRTWIAEHKLFRAELTPSRKIRYGSPEGEHDDCVISGGLAVWGLFSDLYEKYEEPKMVTKGEAFWNVVRADITREKIRKSGEDEEVEIMEEGADMLSG